MRFRYTDIASRGLCKRASMRKQADPAGRGVHAPAGTAPGYAATPSVYDTRLDGEGMSIGQTNGLRRYQELARPDITTKGVKKNDVKGAIGALRRRNNPIVNYMDGLGAVIQDIPYLKSWWKDRTQDGGAGQDLKRMGYGTEEQLPGAVPRMGGQVSATGSNLLGRTIHAMRTAPVTMGWDGMPVADLKRLDNWGHEPYEGSAEQEIFQQTPEDNTWSRNFLGATGKWLTDNVGTPLARFTRRVLEPDAYIKDRRRAERGENVDMLGDYSKATQEAFDGRGPMIMDTLNQGFADSIASWGLGRFMHGVKDLDTRIAEYRTRVTPSTADAERIGGKGANARRYHNTGEVGPGGVNVKDGYAFRAQNPNSNITADSQKFLVPKDAANKAGELTRAEAFAKQNDSLMAVVKPKLQRLPTGEPIITLDRNLPPEIVKMLKDRGLKFSEWMNPEGKVIVAGPDPATRAWLMKYFGLDKTPLSEHPLGFLGEVVTEGNITPDQVVNISMGANPGSAVYALNGTGLGGMEGEMLNPIWKEQVFNERLHNLLQQGRRAGRLTSANNPR